MQNARFASGGSAGGGSTDPDVDDTTESPGDDNSTSNEEEDDQAGRVGDPFRRPGVDGGHTAGPTPTIPESDASNDAGDDTSTDGGDDGGDNGSTPTDDQAGRDGDPLREPGSGQGGHTQGPTPETGAGRSDSRNTPSYDDRVPSDEEMTTGPNPGSESTSPSTGGAGGRGTTEQRSGDLSDDDPGRQRSVVIGASTKSQARAQATQATGLRASQLTIEETQGGYRVAFPDAATRAAQQFDDQYSGVALTREDVTVTEEGEATLTPQAEEQVIEQRAADRLGVMRADVEYENGTIQFETENARRAVLREQYGENADINQLGAGAFQVETQPPGQPQRGQAIAAPADTQGQTVVVPFGEEGQQTIENTQAYSDVQGRLQEQTQTVDTGPSNREQGQAAIDRGNLGDPREIRREDAAQQVSEQVGVPVGEGDVTITETDSGEQRVELSNQARRAVLLSSTSEFLNRDAEVEKTEDGQYRVRLPGDTDATEEALTQKVRTGEAFGGETTISAFGQTVNLDQATREFAGAVEDVAGTAGDYLDRANVLSNRGPGVGENDSQEVRGASSISEASENFMIRSLEGGAAALGDVPRSVLELGEAAADPTAYRVAAEGTMVGVRRVDDISVSSVQAAGEGTVETARRLDDVARENPEAAVGVTAGVLGGALASAGTYAASPVALSRLQSVSPRAARGAEVALDPVRTSARAVSGRVSSAREGTSGAAQDVGRRLADESPQVDVTRDTDAGYVAVDRDLGGYYQSRGQDAVEAAATRIRDGAPTTPDLSMLYRRGRTRLGELPAAARSQVAAVTSRLPEFRRPDVRRTLDQGSRNLEGLFDEVSDSATTPTPPSRPSVVEPFRTRVRGAVERVRPENELSLEGARRRVEFDAALASRRGERGIQRAYEELSTSAGTPGLPSRPSSPNVRERLSAAAQRGRREVTAAQFGAAERIASVEGEVRDRANAVRDLGEAARSGELTIRLSSPGDGAQAAPEGESIDARGVNYSEFFDFAEDAGDDAGTATANGDAGEEATTGGGAGEYEFQERTGTGSDTMRADAEQISVMRTERETSLQEDSGGNENDGIVIEEGSLLDRSDDFEMADVGSDFQDATAAGGEAAGSEVTDTVASVEAPTTSFDDSQPDAESVEVVDVQPWTTSGTAAQAGTDVFVGSETSTVTGSDMESMMEFEDVGTAASSRAASWDFEDDEKQRTNAWERAFDVSYVTFETGFVDNPFEEDLI